MAPSRQRPAGRSAVADPFPLSPSPAWESDGLPTVESCRRAFRHADELTIGLEEELMLVEPATLELAPAIGEALALIGDDGRFANELRDAQLEIVTPVCRTAEEGHDELAAARRHAVARLAGHLRLAASGTHPFSRRWGSISEGERYRQIADEYQWAATRSLACGLHVHVAVDGADRALLAFNALRSFVPEIAALGANSAFFEGVDTGMCSVRPKLNQMYPRSGIPPAFSSWEEFIGFVDWGRAGGLFPDSTHFWWDLRPHLLHGTIEVRACDTQTSVADAGAVAALVQCLIADLLARHDAGEPLPVHDSCRIAENAWRAHRHGMRGWLVDLDSGRPEPTRERVGRLLARLAPVAERLGCERSLQRAHTLLAGNGADRQRYVEERSGLLGLAGWIADETERSPFEAHGA